MSASKNLVPDLRAVVKAVAYWLFCSLLLLLIGTALYTFGKLPLSSLGYASSAISFLASAAAGVKAASNAKGLRLPTVLGSALAICLLALLTGFLIKGEFSRDALLSVLCFTAVGMMVGACLPIRKNRKRRVMPGNQGKGRL